MSYIKSVQRFVSLLAVILLVWTGMTPSFGKIASVNAAIINNEIALPHIASSNDWYEIDKHLAEAMQKAYSSSEEYATAELESWQNQLMQKVDNKFLNWYFSFINQKASEFGVPFAWAVFKSDSILKVLRAEDEKKLNAEEVIQKRMIQDFNNKFRELVLNQESEEYLKRVIESIGRNYASAIGIKLLETKNQYKIDDTNWEEHLSKISQLVYNTGNSKSSLSTDSINSNFLTTILAVATTTISSKLAVKFAAKASSKLAVKSGTSLLLKTGTQLLEPILIVGFLA